MKKTNKGLKEWNATIEALGQGKQTILLRNYRTAVSEFLLYPTVGYTSKKNYLESFQGKYQQFVKENSHPNKKGDKVIIKYFARLEEIVEIPKSKIPSDKKYIWTKDHVKNYMTGKNLYAYVLRVYTLKEPYWAEPKPGALRYVNLKQNVSLEGMKPVLSDSEFAELSM